MADAVVKVTLPEMGESVTEGSIVEWRKRVGDFVAEGDPLVDVTTDKVDVEVPATASGVITNTFGGEGDTIGVGTVLAEIDTSKAGTPTNGKAAAPSNGATAPAPPAAPVPAGSPKLIDVTLPDMGESVTEGTIVEFRVKAGDFVNEGDTIVEVTTDKVDVEVPAPASGTVTQLNVKDGDTVAVGARLAQIDANAAPSDESNGSPAPPRIGAEPAERQPQRARRSRDLTSLHHRKPSASRAKRISISHSFAAVGRTAWFSVPTSCRKRRTRSVNRLRAGMQCFRSHRRSRPAQTSRS